MRILIAEDEQISRRVLESSLARWGYEVVITTDGQEAWEALQQDGAPTLAILDWQMPQMDGLEVCRKVRATPSLELVYLILLTARSDKTDIAAGLEAGANDCMVKPFDKEELLARLRVGLRVVELQQSLAARIRKLEQALAQVHPLEGILPICSYCKSIRDGEEYWQPVESYISQRTAARLSHSICPDCYERNVVPELRQYQNQPADERSGMSDEG